MLKLIIVIFIIISNSLCFSQSGFIDIEFYSSADKVFHSLKLKEEIDSLYKFNSDPFVLLSVTKSSDDKEFTQQLLYLDSIDAEELQLLYVYSCLDTVYKYGYHTDQVTVSGLLNNNNNVRFLLLNGKGQIIYDSTKALTEKKIKELLKF